MSLSTDERDLCRSIRDNPKYSDEIRELAETWLDVDARRED